MKKVKQTLNIFGKKVILITTLLIFIFTTSVFAVLNLNRTSFPQTVVNTNINRLEGDGSYQINRASELYKAYLRPNSLTTNSSNNLSELGTVTGIRIAGVPFGSETTAINELSVLDENNLEVEYTVTSVQTYSSLSGSDASLERNPTSNPSVVSNRANNFLLDDGIFTDNSGLVINDIQAALDVEINISIDTPTTLSNILLAIDISNSSRNFLNPWGTKIGNITILTSDGTTYYAENFEFQNDGFRVQSQIDNGSGEEFNFTLIGDTVSWDKFERSFEEDNETSIYIYTYDSTIRTAVAGQYVFFNGQSNSHTSQSITPLFTSYEGDIKVATLEDENNTNLLDLVSFDYFIEFNQAQWLNSLQQVSDTGIIDSYVSKFSVTTIDQLSLNLINNFDTSFKNPRDFSGSNIQWRMLLTFRYNGNSKSFNSLGNILGILGTFQNIREIEFLVSSQIFNTNYFGYDLNIEELNVLGNAQSIQEISIPDASFSGNYNVDNSDAIIATYGDLASLDQIGNLQILETLNLTSHNGIGLLNNSYASSIQSSSEWIQKLNIDFNLILPNIEFKTNISNLFPTLPDTITSQIAIIENFSIENVVNDGSDGESVVNYFSLVKLTARTFGSPIINLTTNDDSETVYNLPSIFVNGIEIDSVLVNGSFYWDFESETSISPGSINRIALDNLNYFTSDFDPTTLGFALDNLIAISPDPNITSTLPQTTSLINLFPTITTNSLDILEQKINVDGIEYDTFVYDSRVLWDYDISLITYSYVDTSGTTLYFTTLNNALQNLQATEENYLDLISQNQITLVQINDQISSLNEQRIDFIINSSNLLSVPEPIPFSNNLITIDEVGYERVVVDGTTLYWNFDDEVQIENVAYYNSNNGDYYTSLFDQFGRLINNLVEIEVSEAYPENLQLSTAVADPGTATSVDDIFNTTISVDDVDYGVVIEDGLLYYQYDISQIEFLIIDRTGGINTSLYFTSMDLIPQTYLLSDIQSLAQSEFRDVPQPNRIVRPDSTTIQETSILTIDGQTYETTLRNGEWYWEVDSTILDSISFSDSSNNFYSTNSLTDALVISGRLSNAVVDSSLYDVLPDDSSLPQFTAPILQSNYQDVALGYLYNGVNYDYYLTNGRYYIRSEHAFGIQYYVDNNRGLVNYYSSLSNVPSVDLPSTWSVDVTFSTLVPTENARPIIPLPADRIDPYAPITIVNEDGNNIIVNVITGFFEEQEVIVYENLEEIRKIKFVDSSGIYYQELIAENINLNLTSINLDSSYLEQLPKPPLSTYFEIVERANTANQQLIIVASVAGAIVLVTFVIIVAIKVRRK